VRATRFYFCGLIGGELVEDIERKEETLERIKIVTDNGSDLSEELAEELDIRIVPLVVTFGDRTYEDTELSHDEFWRLAGDGPQPTTSQPPVGAFQQAFKELVERGYQVLCVALTSHHSGTFNSAWSAAQAFGSRVTVIDSLSLSWGQAWQAIEAAKMAMQSATVQAILQRLRSIRERTHFFIQLDTVENIRRGGRASKLMPVIDRLVRALRLKPIVNLVDGELKLFGVARSYRKGIERIKAEVAALGPLEHLAVIHTRRSSVAKGLADELARLTNMARERIVVGETGAALSCHAGAGVIAAAAVTAR